VLRRRHAQFDLAILVNPKEPFPPSDEPALRLIARAAERQNLRAEFVGPKDLDKVSRFDALFIRETTNIDNHTFTFARIAEANGMPVIDDSVSILRCSNKVFLREAMVRARIATPATELLTKANFQEVARRIEYPCVLKIPDGSFSRGVFKIADHHEFVAKATELLEDSAIILAQEFLPTEFDWRIGILDGKPLFACKYHMVKGHWQVYNHALKRKINYGRTETVLVEDAPANIIKAAVRASLQMGRGLYGVDLKEVGSTAYVIEVNDNPNLDAGTEDKRAGEALYDSVISVFRQRILTAKGLSQPAQANRAA
jgi:glutathione synthase/RimK-type ligase-like ATP-grasp enzyme